MKNNIHFIGFGKLGTTLARAMYESGWFVPYYWIRNEIDYIEANRYLPDTKFELQIKASVIKSAEVILITVPDIRIGSVAEYLSQTLSDWDGKIVIHTSGCLNSSELEPLKQNGATVGSIHPMQTFHSRFLPPNIFENIYIAVEGNNKIATFADELCKDLNAKMFKIKPDQKLLYHIAAVSLSNFLNGVINYGENLFSRLGIDQELLQPLIQPIITTSINNYFQANGKSSLTGPLTRGDFSVVEKHLSYLKKNHEDLLPVYSEISKYIFRFILDKDINNYEQLKKVLLETE